MWRVSWSVLLWSFVAACSGGSASIAFPPAAVPSRPDISEWPDVGAVVIDDVGELTYRPSDDEERLIAVLSRRQRIKILSEVGLKWSTFEIPVDAYSTVAQVRARSISASGRERWLEDADIRSLPNQDGIDLPDVRTLRFEVPGVEVGGVIDVVVTRVYAAPELVPIYVLGRELPVMRSELSVITHRGVKIDYRTGDGERLTDDRPLRRELGDGVQRYVFVKTNLPAYYHEPDMPHIARVSPWVATVVTRAKVGLESIRIETWRDVVLRVMEQLGRVGGDAIGGPPKIRYGQVRDALRGVERQGLGVRSPKKAVALMDGEPACTRDAAGLLLRAFEGIGPRFYPALITSSAGPPALEGFPSFYPFIRVVVAVDVSEQVANDPTCREDPISRGLLCAVPKNSFAFVDPLCAGCRYGELPTELTGGRALIIMPKGAQWVDVPEDPPERNRVMTQFRLALDVDGSVKGNMNGELTGAPARRLRRALGASHLRTDGRNELVMRTLFGERDSPTLTRSTATPRRKVDVPLSLKGKLETKLERLTYEDFRLNPADVIGPVIPIRFRGTRRYPRLLDGPGWFETVASIELPVGYQAEVPPLVKIVEPFAEYAAGFAVRNGSLSYSRRLVFKRHIMEVADWRRFKDFFDRINAAESAGIRVHLGGE